MLQELKRRFFNLFVPARNWWNGAFGRKAAYIEGRNAAIDNAAVLAYDMGHPDVRKAINNLYSDHPCARNPHA